MTRIDIVVVATWILLLCTPSVQAQVSIDQLIRDAGLQEGPVAVRDIPGWSTPKKILVRGDADLVAELQDIVPGAKFIAFRSDDEAIGQAADADVIIGSCNEQLVNAAPKVKWVQIFWAGVERCLGAARLADGSIVLSNMQKMSSPVIAEHAIAMMLSLTRNLTSYAKDMSDGDWRARRSEMVTVSGRTMLVVGLGGIGVEVARRGAGLGMRVVGTRNSSRDGPEYVAYVGLSDELLELAAEADVIINALPITPATTGLFNKEFFDAVGKGGFFINVGRGASVVTDDLVAAIESGQLAGAGLDVTEPEPLPADHPLWQMSNVIITPHVASAGETREGQAVLLKENLRRYAAGDALLNVVDPKRGY
jgi:phosphoglycerate dehydrogenase-like enzyme